MTDRSAERAAGAVASRSRDDTAVRPMTERIPTAFADPSQEARRNVEPAKSRRPSKAPRRARLRLTRVDPWSVMKTSFLLSIALGVVTIVAVFIVWTVLGAAGVWDSINKAVSDIVGDSSTWNIKDYIGTSRVMGFTMVIAVVDVVLLTAVATLGAFLYNMAAALLGGVEVTLSEDD